MRGSSARGVHIFKGLRYGESTAGAARFLPPSKPKPWTGVRTAVKYGPRAPQPLRRMVPEIGDALVGPGPTSEDCLLLNVWTPAIERNGRRPVMVWLHGGGFRTGSGNSVFYDGRELARKHGAVVVTVTHRLNALGFLYLAEMGGEKYRQSSNVGMQDIVMALEWVRDNIDAFGGNPGNVTIFGQSGGGGKTAILTGMPAAKGLFHRAIIQSTLADTAITALEPHEAAAATELLLSRVGVKPAELDKLQQMPAEMLMQALTGAGDGDISLRYVPVKDGRTLTVHPFQPSASPLAATVPILCGSNETESVPYQNPDDPFWTSEIGDEAELRERVKRTVRVDDAEAGRLIALYRNNRPTDTRDDLALIMASDNSPLRLSSYAIAERKSAQGQAPVYMYYFKWRSPVRQRQAALDALHGAPVRVRSRGQHAVHERNGQGSLCAGRSDVGGLGLVRANREPESRRAAGLAGVRRGKAGHDGVRHRVPDRQRPVRTGAPRDAGGAGVSCARRRRTPCAPVDRAATRPDRTETSAAGTA